MMPLLLGASRWTFGAVSPVDLTISIIFAAGQIVVGGALTRRGPWRELRRWQHLGRWVLGLMGVWLVCSGMAELFVAAVEVAARGWGGFRPETVDGVRRAADKTLFGVTMLLLAMLLVALIGRSVAARRVRQRSRNADDGE